MANTIAFEMSENEKENFEKLFDGARGNSCSC